MLFPLSSFRPRSAFLWAAGCLGLALIGVSAACAQDRLFLADNTVQEGKVTGVTGGNVLLTITTTSGSGQTAVALARITRAEVAAPVSYQSGLAAYKAGNWDKALADLKPLADQFRGLSADWVQQAAGLLGDLYIEKKEPAKAEAAYNDFRQSYPRATGGSTRLSVGQARLAYAKNNAAQAKQQLMAITQTAMKEPALVSTLDGAAYGQAFFLLGQIQEKENSYQPALESYLCTVTLFYQDSAVAARAQQSADALRAAHQGITAP